MKNKWYNDSMLEPQDIQKLMEVLATKEDIRSMKENLDSVGDILGNLVTATDRLVSRTEMLNQEYLVLKERDSRYERWFLQIAEKVGITLKP
jgi:hypothetical protein